MNQFGTETWIDKPINGKNRGSRNRHEHILQFGNVIKITFQNNEEVFDYLINSVGATDWPFAGEKLNICPAFYTKTYSG